MAMAACKCPPLPLPPDAIAASSPILKRSSLLPINAHTSSPPALRSSAAFPSRRALFPPPSLPPRRKLKNVRSVLAEEASESANEPSTGGSALGSRWDRAIIKAEQGFNIFLTDTVIFLLDALYADRHYSRFYVLETIARVPYFAFLSVLHMYESFGWWRRSDYLKVHFAQNWNELHHLLIMEALGGDERWFDRFLAQHISVFYFFLAGSMYLVSPRMAYHLSECVERHAFSTYDKFIKQHGDELVKLPAPAVAVKYYTEGDLYMFDEFQTNRIPESRRPKVDNLYDVFVNIRDDEAEHCKTMVACQTRGNIQSPHAVMPVKNIDGESPPAECSGILECLLTSSLLAQKVGEDISANKH